MPNWCSNSLVLRHSDKNLIDKIEKAFEEENLFQTFRPIPAELYEQGATEDRERELHEVRYNWVLKNWGTKWEVEAHDVDRISQTELQVSFDSAWSPPVAFYQYLVESLGFSVEAKYYEGGNWFAGEVFGAVDSDGIASFSDTEYSIDNAPEDLLEYFGHNSEDYE